MRRKENTLSSQWEPKVKTSKLPNARENTGNQVVTIFRFESDWLREWCEFLLDQSQRSKAKPMQSQMTFDTYLRIALNFSILSVTHHSNGVFLSFITNMSMLSFDKKFVSYSAEKRE